MRYLCVVLVTCLLLGGVADGRAQASPSDDAALREIYEQFFEALRVGGANGVIGYLRQSGSIAPALLPVLEREARAYYLQYLQPARVIERMLERASAQRLSAA